MRWLLYFVFLGGTAGFAADLDRLLAAHRANPGDWKIAHETALAYTERTQFKEAAAFYRKALAINPEFLPARKNLAVVLWFDRQYAEAEKLFRVLASRVPKDPVPQLYLGLAEHGRGRHAQAHRHFAAAGDLALANPDVLPQVAESYLAAKDRSVVASVPKVLAAARDVQLSMRVAAVLDRYGAAEEAYNAYRDALSYAPAHEPLYIAFASFASAHQNNRYGIEILNRGLKQLPESAPLRFHRALLMALQGDREAASQGFVSAAEADPRWALPVLAQGVLQLEDGRAAEAAATFERALREHPDNVQASYLRALALSRTGDEANRPEQIRLLQRALRTNANDARALALLGQTYAAAGRDSDAITFLQKAVSADPSSPTAHYQLSLALRRTGRIAEADRHMARFKEIRGAAAKQESELVQFLKVNP